MGPVIRTKKEVDVETFIEQDCTVTHEGRDFTAGGAWLADCTDGYRRGVVYVNDAGCDPYCQAEVAVTDWHGNVLARGVVGARYRGNHCRMRCLTFTHNGVVFTGRYCPDTSQAVRVRSTKKIGGG
jgi:hypothetical protein